jgi:hypothetical protein
LHCIPFGLVEHGLEVLIDLFENVRLVGLGIVPKRTFLLGGHFGESLGDIIDRCHRPLWVKPEVRVLPLLLPDALFFGIERRRETDQFDTLADID